jgi:hypothetical protein
MLRENADMFVATYRVLYPGPPPTHRRYISSTTMTEAYTVYAARISQDRQSEPLLHAVTMGHSPHQIYKAVAKVAHQMGHPAKLEPIKAGHALQQILTLDPLHLNAIMAPLTSKKKPVRAYQSGTFAVRSYLG